MGPFRCQRRRPAFCRWDHTVRTGYRAARRDHPAGGRLERHSELRVGSAAGSATWLICHRSRELIRVADGFGLAWVAPITRLTRHIPRWKIIDHRTSDNAAREGSEWQTSPP